MDFIFNKIITFVTVLFQTLQSTTQLTIATFVDRSSGKIHRKKLRRWCTAAKIKIIIYFYHEQIRKVKNSPSYY